MSRYWQGPGGAQTPQSSSRADNVATGVASVAETQNADQQLLSPSLGFSTLINFDGGAEGGNPAGSLIQGPDGNLYGTTYDGGNTFANCTGPTCGTVFKISPNGTLTTLYSFCSQADCADGGSPAGPLVLGTDGDFYGITESGGTGAGCYAANACGTAFKITPNGTLTTIYNWCSQPNCADGHYGEFPEAATFVHATDGNFYGTNESGGALGAGTAFKLTPSGSLTTLHTFCSQTNCLDGGNPVGLIQAVDGNFYGVNYDGGTVGVGTVYKITPTGALTTLYSFCSQTNCTDGAYPSGPVIQAADGSFYGTTTFGGANVNSTACMAQESGGYCGTVFEITSAGTLTTIYNFCSLANCADGASPDFSLVQATDGNFYGATVGGGNDSCNNFGSPGCGTIFKVTPRGTLTTLNSFDAEFQTPEALFQATSGTFYGVTAEGGTYNTCGGLTCGIVYSLDTGLGAFVETVPASGHVGKAVRILGNNLLDATAVSFNGAKADFKAISHSEIRTSVPSGATTGFVTVTRSGTTLKSNVEFQVIP
jgi:uncharacterized repeat protein (TIGR03803 family)